MLTPMAICATAIAGIKASTPTMRTFEKNRILKVVIRNRLSGTIVRGSRSHLLGHTVYYAPHSLQALLPVRVLSNLIRCCANARPVTV